MSIEFDDIEVPDSLAEWVRLQQLSDQREPALLDEKGQMTEAGKAEMKLIYTWIVAAWRAAPFLDRRLVDWRQLKKVWRERHEALEGHA